MNEENNYEQLLSKDLEILQRISGNTLTMGKYAGEIRNPYWRVKDKNNQKEFYAMYCEPNSICYFSTESLDKILKNENKSITWYKHGSGYICSTINKKSIYMHNLIMSNDEEVDPEQNTVIHITTNKLDNRLTNLKIINDPKDMVAKEKISRRVNAVKLPDGIKHEDIPKYACYAIEKGSAKYTKEYFYIKGHAALNGKKWTSKKGKNISIKEKLKETCEKIKELDQM